MDKKIFPDEPEIPILPNLFTAGNLVCGFFAILTIFEGINQACLLYTSDAADE